MAASLNASVFLLPVPKSNAFSMFKSLRAYDWILAKVVGVNTNLSIHLSKP
jgi:hypothetical protein